MKPYPKLTTTEWTAWKISDWLVTSRLLCWLGFHNDQHMWDPAGPDEWIPICGTCERPFRGTGPSVRDKVTSLVMDWLPDFDPRVRE